MKTRMGSGRCCCGGCCDCSNAADQFEDDADSGSASSNTSGSVSAVAQVNTCPADADGLVMIQESSSSLDGDFVMPPGGPQQSTHEVQVAASTLWTSGSLHIVYNPFSSQLQMFLGVGSLNSVSSEAPPNHTNGLPPISLVAATMPASFSMSVDMKDTLTFGPASSGANEYNGCETCFANWTIRREYNLQMSVTGYPPQSIVGDVTQTRNICLSFYGPYPSSVFSGVTPPVASSPQTLMFARAGASFDSGVSNVGPAGPITWDMSAESSMTFQNLSLPRCDPLTNPNDGQP